MPRLAPLPLAAVLLLAAAKPASAQLAPGVHIDLVQEKGFLSYSQTYGKWAGYPIGANQGSQADLDNDVTIGNCGCLLSTLGSIAEYNLGGSSVPLAPWQELYTAQMKMSFSPRYLDLFLMMGDPADPVPPRLGWGYKPLEPGSCGTAPLRWALESMAQSSEFVDPITGRVILRTPNGLRWAVYTPGPSAWDKIDSNLLAGQPTLVVIEFPNGSGGTSRHAQLVVGWDGPANGYLIMDPAWPMLMLPARPGGGELDSYTGWLTSIVMVFDVQTVTTPLSGDLRRLILYDDPGPIELLVIAPDGRRTGFDPALGRSVREVESAEAYELGAWAKPAGPLTDAEPARFLEVSEPADGTWRFLVSGTGTGDVPLTLATLVNGDETVLLDVVRPVTPGSTVKFQVTYHRVGPKTVTEVPDFTPEARFLTPVRTRIDEAIALDGRASFDADGTVVGYLWDFADGTTATGATASHSWSTPGVYPVRLTVTDAAGVTGTALQQVSVSGPPEPGGWITERVSTSAAGHEANLDSLQPRITPDGGYVVFESDANLAPLDFNGVTDIFVKDLATGAIERVSVSSSGQEAASDPSSLGSRAPTISADGRFVAFTSWAANLVPGDVNGWEDVFVHDRLTGTTELVSVSTAGGQGSNRSGAAVISADGRFVAFRSAAPDLVIGGNGLENVYVRDRQAGTTELASAAADGTPASNNSDSPGISADGRYVVFSSVARNLVAQDIGVNRQVFLRDRQAGTVEVVSLTSAGAIAHGEFPSISGDGRFVAFNTGYNLGMVDGDFNNVNDVFVRDRQAATTTRVSVSTFGAEGNAGSLYAAISLDGRWVAFQSTASNLVADDNNRTGPLPAGTDVFLHDRQTGVTERASVATDGAEALPDSGTLPFVSVGSGGAVAFSSSATNLVAGDSNAAHDIFVHRRPAQRPVADPSGPYAGWASGPGLPAHVTLDARRSFDPGGAPLTARWDFGDGTPVVEAAAASPIDHAYAAAGEFTVMLVVTTGTQDSEPVLTTASVRAAQPASAHTVAVPACGAPGATVRLHARGEPLAPAAGGWDFGAGLPPPTSGAMTPATLPVSLDGGAGTRTLTGAVDAVEITGGVEMTTRVSVALPADLPPGSYAIAVGPASSMTFTVPCPPEQNPRPRAVAGGPYQAVVGTAVTLDGSRSSSPGGAALQYTWDFGDDQTGTGATPQHAYAKPGTYLVTLVVHDGTRSSIPVVRGASYGQVVVTATTTKARSGCGCGQGDAGSLAEVLAGIAALALFRRRRCT